MDPVPLKLNFAIDVPETGISRSYIDISQCVSLASRKLMRQGLNWAVASVKITMPAASSAQGNAVYISTLQNTWMTYNAWKKAFYHWLKQQNDALAEVGAPTAVGAYRDFKVYAELEHQTDGVANNLRPVSIGPGGVSGPFVGPVIVGAGFGTLGADWQISEIVFPNFDGVPGVTQEATVFVHGPSNETLGQFGLVDQYHKSRPRTDGSEPDVDPAFETSMYSRMIDVGSETTEILENAVGENNTPPYRLVDMAGGDEFYEMENVAFALNTSTDNVRQYTFGGFNAPCGLIRIDQVFSEGTSIQPLLVELSLVPGDNRGYLAVPMQEC